MPAVNLNYSNLRKAPFRTYHADRAKAIQIGLDYLSDVCGGMDYEDIKEEYTLWLSTVESPGKAVVAFLLSNYNLTPDEVMPHAENCGERMPHDFAFDVPHWVFGMVEYFVAVFGEECISGYTSPNYGSLEPLTPAGWVEYAFGNEDPTVNINENPS